jgi:putative PIN family toxin of toxin-antitoxin system
VKRVTADSNQYISALLRGGKPLQLLELARSGQIELAVSDDILNEVGRVLRDKFKVPAEDVEEYRNQVLGFARHVTPAERLRVVTSDADDDKILECAVAAGSEIVVTGDAHLLSMGDFSGIRIQRVAEFLAEFQAR